MAAPVLATKLHVPLPRPDIVSRPRLVERLSDGLRSKLTLVSAPAGFGKTTLLGEWVAGCRQPAAWLSLDEGDGDPARFLAYLVAALQRIAPNVGAGVSSVVQSPQPPPPESVLVALLNDVATVPDDFVLVLDDYHVIDTALVDRALAFLLDHLPPRMHLVIATREDPQLPLARLRAGGQLTELRVTDLRFTRSEAAGFLNQVMGLGLSADDVAALETRTEGWIAGLQLAAISMRGRQDTTGFIRSFTGSHHFVMDYLVQEVLQQQPERVQDFLLRTSILDRLCGPLCDAVLLHPSGSGQETLERLARANLFVVPMDDERRWYRYHHLFADLLRQRLQQSGVDAAELRRRASLWHEDSGLDVEAFRYAGAAGDVERAARLLEGNGMPLQFRGAVGLVLSWLESLPKAVLDANPSLWVMFASALSMAGRLPDVEQKLQAAEAALQDAEPDARTRNLVGHIAAIRALLGAVRYETETIIVQSNRALEYLHPDNLPVRTATTWKLGWAYQLQGDRTAARRAYAEAISASQASGNAIICISATTGLGDVQEADNELHQAAETYRRVLQLVGDSPLPSACQAHLGLGRILYEWNDLDAAEQHAQRSARLAQQWESTHVGVACEVLLARLKLARGDTPGAAAVLTSAGRLARQHDFAREMPEVAAVQVRTLLQQGDVAQAVRLARTHQLPVSLARVYLARGDAPAALAALEPLRREAEARGWEDRRLRVMVLQAVALRAHGEDEEAARGVAGALALAEPGGHVRVFVDEGVLMARLLSEVAARGVASDHAARVLAAFPPVRPPVEPLSRREVEVLQLIAQGLSNHEIGERLFLALDTVKGHNRKIFDKLQAQRRTEAVARARELGLL